MVRGPPIHVVHATINMTEIENEILKYSKIQVNIDVQICLWNKLTIGNRRTDFDETWYERYDRGYPKLLLRISEMSNIKISARICELGAPLNAGS